MIGRLVGATSRLRDVGAVRVESTGSLEARQGLWVVLATALLATVVQVLLALQLPAPWSLPDELIYAEMAKSLGEGALPAVRDESTRAYGILYPLLIAPAWALFDDPAHAYVAAKVLNAIAMSGAAVPAYFLGRRFLGVRPALVVAGFSVFVPSMLYTGSLLTEVVLYPVMLAALLALVASLQQPTASNQLLAVAAIGLAVLAKPLAIVLVPAYLCLVLHLGVLDRRDGGSVRRRLRAQSTALGILATLALVGMLASLLIGDPTALLGSYGVVLGHVDLSGTLVWFVRQAAGLDLYVGIAPFAASLVLACVGLTRASGRLAREFSALLIWVLGPLLLAVAAYSSKPVAGAAGYAPTEARLHERNIFVLVPLLLVGLALYFELGRPGGRRTKVACLVLSALLPGVLQLERLIHNANLQALAVIPWAADGIRSAWPATLAPLSVAAVAALLLRSRSAPLVTWGLVAVVFGVTTVAAQASQASSSLSRSTVGVGLEARWIDRSVPAGVDVLALWVHPGEEADLGAAYRTIWMSEFYNRTVGTVVEVGTPMPYALPHADGVVLDGVVSAAKGKPFAARYVFAPCWIRVRGTVVARDPRTGGRVYGLPRKRIRLMSASATAGACIRERG